MENITNIDETVLGYPERNHKDKLFRKIFGGEDKRSSRWRLELYNALTGKKHTNPEELEITTLENVIFFKMKNDVSFLVDSQMNLWEHQSTFNPNMPLRGLLYFAILYHRHLFKLDYDIYGSRLINIPTPRYVVFYNGDEKMPEKTKLKLSDAFIDFEEKGDFEWTATMININKNHNESLQKNCKPLYDYSIFVDRIKTNINSGMENESAVDEALDWAIGQNLLEGYIMEQKAEFKFSILTEFDQEKYDRSRRQEGYEQKAIEAAINLLKMKLGTPEQIAQAQGLPLEKVLELQSQLSNTSS